MTALHFKLAPRARRAHLAGTRRLAIFAVMLVSLAQAAFAQIIPTNRIVDWSHAGSPTNGDNWPVYTNAMAAGAKGDGVTDDSKVLAAIIAACPPGQVVYLPAGNYVISTNFYISKSIVIRGAGSTNTILSPTTNAFNPIFTFQPKASRWSGNQQFAPLAGGFTKGSTNLTLTAPVPNAVANGFVPGATLLLDQLNDGTFVNGTGCNGFCTYCSISNGTRALTQTLHLASVDSTGTNITVDTPLYWNYGTNYPAGVLPYMGTYTNNLSPEISWFPGDDLTNIGLEHLTINDQVVSNGIGAFNVIVMCYYCDNSWCKDVTTEYGSQAHFLLYNCYHFTLSDSYLYNAKSFQSMSYGVEICNSSSECLIQDNIMNTLSASVVFAWGSTGNVASYNYITNALFNPITWEANAMSVHDNHCMYNLLEGNYCPQISMDNTHGSNSHETAFRNVSTGWQPSRTYNCIAMDVQFDATYVNIVGNVLGTPPSTMISANGILLPASYIETAKTYNIGIPSIYDFGYFGNSTDKGGWDTNILNTVIMEGNFNYVTDSIHWSDTNNTNLPNSYYLSSQPAWWTNWGSTPWPPVGPDVTNMANILPANLRFLETTGSPMPTNTAIAPPAPPPIPAPTNLRWFATPPVNVNQSLGSVTNVGDAWLHSGNNEWADMGDYASYQYLSIQFTAGSTYTVGAAALDLKASGLPNGMLTLSIYPDNGGAPASAPVAGGSSIPLSATVLTTNSAWINFTGLSAQITAGTKYWVVLEDNTIDRANFIYWLGSAQYSAASDNSGNGTSWSKAGTWNQTFQLFHQ